MLRAAILAAILALPAFPAAAQDRDRTLADIRQELQVLFADLQSLRRELNTTGPATGAPVGGDTLQRLDAIEAEMRRLNRLTEELELRIARVAQDGGNRVSDLEFRLCELEAECDIAALGQGTTLGGGAADPGGAEAAPAPGPSLAVGEQGDFDRAQAALEADDYATAAQGFAAFVETYPGSPLATRAQFLRAEAEAGQGAWQAAARAYLNAFSAAPDGPRAPSALLNLGTSLERLGQTEEACLALAEVDARFPASAEAGAAQTARAQFGCR